MSFMSFRIEVVLRQYREFIFLLCASEPDDFFSFFFPEWLVAPKQKIFPRSRLHKEVSPNQRDIEDHLKMLNLKILKRVGVV